jgi:hypothetical protein
MADQIRATPRNPFFGLFSDLVNAPLSYMSDPRRTQQMQGVASFLRSTGVPYTLENLSYDPSGRGLFTGAGGLGGTTRLRPEAAEAALTVAPFVGPAAQLGVRGAMATGRALGPTAARMAEGYLQRQRLMPGVVPDQTGLLGAVQKPQAPVSDLGFYSAAEQAAMNLQRSKGTGQSFLNDLMKAPDVKKDELQYTGLDEFLKDKPNVTRQEVTDYLSKNKVDVQEVQLGGNVVEDSVGVAKRKAVFDKYEPEIQALYKEMDSFGYDTPRERLQSTDNRLRKLQEIRDREADAAYVIPEPIPTKFSQFTLPGGENYREILLKLPTKGPSTIDAMPDSELRALIMRNDRNADVDGLSRQDLVSMIDGMGLDSSDLSRLRVDNSTQFKSSHFDEPNILAHMRVNDRVDADGKKMLLVEEIQSDWHQAGRTKGYDTPAAKAAEQQKLDNILAERQGLLDEQRRLEELALPYTSQGKDAPSNIVDRWSAVSNRINNLQTEQNRLGRAFGQQVPDAPFKDNWYQLSLKRLVKYAADNGYDRIGLTTGRQQAERFDLSKQVDELIYRKNPDGTYMVTAQVGGSGNMIGNAIPEGKLSDYVGKEVASKIVDNSGKDVNLGGSGSVSQPKDMYKSLSGIDLKIGGEGMKKYYDEIYPKYLEKYGKKFDAKVGETRIKTGNAYAQTKGIPAEETVRYIDITPKMKEGTSKGQPLFAAVPAGTLVGGEIDYSDPFANTIDDTTR